MKINQVGDSIRYFDINGLWKCVLDVELHQRNRSVYSSKFKKFLDAQRHLDKNIKFPVTMELDHNDMTELRMQIGINDKGDSIWLDVDFSLVEQVSHWTKAA